MAPLMRRTVFLLAAAAVALLPTRGDTAAAPSALVLGDSLAQGTRPFLAGYLPGWRLRYVVGVGVRTEQGVDRVRTGASRCDWVRAGAHRCAGCARVHHVPRGADRPGADGCAEVRVGQVTW